MTLIIRPATPSDSPALSRICLLTGNAGRSAENDYDYGELVGLVYAVPYVHLPATWGFVLVDSDNIVGYIVGASDTRAFETAAQETWWPRWANEYPLTRGGTEADMRYMKMLQDMPTTNEACLAFSPAHMHINLLPQYQRQGWGRKMIDVAVQYLREKEGINGLWLGYDPKNGGAKRFYERLGFKPIEGMPETTVGLAFDEWK